MKRKIKLLLCVFCVCECLTGCTGCSTFENENDKIEIYNKTIFSSDNINIDIKDGYFYDRHEKFTVDDNTIGVTIYFSGSEDSTWDSK